jgi:hypothetical protein
MILSPDNLIRINILPCFADETRAKVRKRPLTIRVDHD